jgi:anaerobic magnesium-protoporphyrin IX monomethyl ester cyclase
LSETRPKIVLFNPQASEKLTYDGPPLSILMAASLIDPKDYDVRIIDWHYTDWEERIAKECRDALVFGVTCMTGYQIGRMLEAVRLARKANPRIKVVCGGWHATLLPQQTIGHDLIDYIVMGQGPRPFKALMDAIRDSQLPSHIPGVGYKTDQGIHINERPPIEPITSFPYPPYHLLDNLDDFLIETAFAKRVLYLLTSQGCPANCYFCSEASFHHRKWSGRPVAELISIIADIKQRHHIDGVAVADSTFFVNERRVAEFCEKLAPLGLRWGSTSSRPDQLARYSDTTWRLMKESGLYDIFLGVESARDETLRVMNKGCKIEHTRTVLKKAREFGIRIQCAFVIGVPGVDIQEDFEADMAFINELRRTDQGLQFHMFTFAPFPGIPFLEEAFKLGYKQPQALEDWGNYNLHMAAAPWIPKKYPSITSQLSVYFMFDTGNGRKIVQSGTPRWLHWLALPAERVFYHLARFRITHSFFRVPMDYCITKFVFNNRHRLFPRQKLNF